MSKKWTHMHWFFIKKSKVENESVNNELKVTFINK